MVATNAFGMGIDKGDVKLVVHMELPSTIEAYFQEAGRSGRNGEQAYAFLLANKTDIKKQKDLLKLMEEKSIENNDDRVYSSQLLGMSDNISYNLSNANYNVSKYVPYGPVKKVIPYLIRRAEENRSISGQMGRELKNILEERKRRKAS